MCGVVQHSRQQHLREEGNSHSYGARPVHLIIKMIKWIRTSRLSIQNPLSLREGEFFIANLLVRIRLVTETFQRTGLASWEFDFHFPGSRISTFLTLSLLYYYQRRLSVAPCTFGSCICAPNPCQLFERRGNTLKAINNFYLAAKARIWA